MMLYIYTLLLAAAAAVVGKYVYVRDRLSWGDAQDYCRARYTELAPIPSRQDLWRIHRAAGRSLDYAVWVGLYYEEPSAAGGGWLWSGCGGSHAPYLPWAYRQPSFLGQSASLCTLCRGHGYGLYARKQHQRWPFFCLNLVVVATEPRTWEGALEYCRGRHEDLASLPSETELLLARREMGEAEAGERVWVGLRHFGASWWWMQGEALGNNASMRMGMLGEHCFTCGSLSHDGELQGLDCSTELHFLCY